MAAFRTALLTVTIALLPPLPLAAQEKLPVVATFSILADLAREVGGERVAVVSLVPPNADAHVFAPSPADAKALAAARLVVSNGLGFEGWIERLLKVSGGKAPVVVASAGIKPRRMEQGGHGHAHAAADPHAWQSVANAKIYVGNIRDGLIAADPAGRAAYEANARAYLEKLEALEREVRAMVERLPADRRRIITSHDAFGYFQDAYRIEFIAPQGVSTETEVSARDLARIIAQVRRQKIPAIFLENVSDPRLQKRIAEETGAKMGGTLYSDALTDEKGPAPTYIDMIRHNIRTLGAALMS